MATDQPKQDWKEKPKNGVVREQLPIEVAEKTEKIIVPIETPQKESGANKEMPKVDFEKSESFLDEAIEGLRKKLKRPKKHQHPLPQVKDALTVEIEHIMQEGLEDAYTELSPIEQQEFKLKGEEVALKIRLLLRETHVKIKKIFKLLVDWLKMLPGVNRFFLEQEAKIKADSIISLHHQKNMKK